MASRIHDSDDRMRGKYLVATWLGLLLTTWTIVIVVVNGLWQLGKWVLGV